MLRRTIFILLAVLTVTGFSLAADTAMQNNVLKPPKGAQVALVVFEDLQCPDCARAAPLLEEAQHAYKIPLVRHDFPLPQHNWSKDAAIIARFFDTKSKKLGNEFRDYCFRHQEGPDKEQPTIQSPQDMRAQAERFAAEHNLTLPLVIDPDGALEKKVEADKQLGISIGISHTPTIYVVSNSTTNKPFVEIVDRSELFHQIDDMLAHAKSASATGSNSKHTRVKKTSLKQ